MGCATSSFSSFPAEHRETVGIFGSYVNLILTKEAEYASHIGIFQPIFKPFHRACAQQLLQFTEAAEVAAAKVKQSQEN